MIPKLPRWVLTNVQPAFYDSESVTAVEMVAKLYSKMQELVDNYNEFVDSVNTEIELFETELNGDQEAFKECINQLISDYISSIDIRMDNQDLKIANAIDDLDNRFYEALHNGTITASLDSEYNTATEELVLSINVVESEE